MNILYFWMAIVLVFIIIEFSTSIFYGLAIAFSAGVVLMYVYFSGETTFTIVQGIIFTLSSAIFAFTLPRVLASSAPDIPQGFDRYTGEIRTVKKISGELKISLDGVEYVIDADEEISAGDKVEIIGHKGTGMKVVKI